MEVTASIRQPDPSNGRSHRHPHRLPQVLLHRPVQPALRQPSLRHIPGLLTRSSSNRPPLREPAHRHAGPLPRPVGPSSHGRRKRFRQSTLLLRSALLETNGVYCPCMAHGSALPSAPACPSTLRSGETRVGLNTPPTARAAVLAVPGLRTARNLLTLTGMGRRDSSGWKKSAQSRRQWRSA